MTHLVKFISLLLLFSLNQLIAMEDSFVGSNQEEFGEFQAAKQEAPKKSLPSIPINDGSCSASQEDLAGSPVDKSLIGFASEEKDNTPLLDNQYEADQLSRSSGEKKSKSLSRSSSRSTSRSRSKSQSTSKSKQTPVSSVNESSASISANLESEEEEDIDSSSSESYQSSDSSDSGDEADKICTDMRRNFSVEKNIEVDNSSDFVRFFKEDYEFPFLKKAAVEKFAFSLEQGKKLSRGEKKEYANNETLITCIAKLTRPQIVLIGKQKEAVEKDSLQLLEQCLDVKGTPKDTSKIQKVTAKLNDKDKGFDLLRLIKGVQNGVMRNKSDLISLESLGSCIAFNKYNNVIYVGCQNGLIYAFSAEEKKLVAAFKAHKKPVSALKIIKKGSAFVSHANEDATYVWSIDDTRARIKLDDQEFSKTYITADDNQIVRSHIGGKSLVSSWVGAYSVAYGVYTIPHGYLQAKVPGDDSSRIAFLYCMKKLHDKKVCSQNTLPTIKRLLDSYIINTFEPPVTESLRLQLESYTKKDLVTQQDLEEFKPN